MKTKIIRRADLCSEQIQNMFEVMREYYEGVQIEEFEKDLSECESVILLCSPNGAIQGFSTIHKNQLQNLGKRKIALFSGDTVLRRKYWGNGALAHAFGRYLFTTKIKHPFTDVYWFLTSKGYKTYLLMTNNFPIHYPRYDVPTPPDVKAMMDRFYLTKFNNEYRPEAGLVIPNNPNPCRLRETVATIGSHELIEPKIAFFVDQNREWNKGHELGCIAKVSIMIPIRYTTKRLRKTLVRFASQWLRPVTVRS
jgi:hypothetical protein